MNGRIAAVVSLCLAVFLVPHGGAAPQAKTGTLKGTIKLLGKSPGNDVIRMGTDPKCAEMNRGKMIANERFAADKAGGFANVFVRVQGTFPATPVPATPAKIEQRGCIFTPRMVGVRVGQTLQIRNSDPLSHNSHSQTVKANIFNVGQPREGLTYDFKAKDEEVLLKITCDIHRWMEAYVGIVSNPYFAVSEPGGGFVIDKVPEGSYTVEARHEFYGPQTKSVKIVAGAITSLDFSFDAAAKPNR